MTVVPSASEERPACSLQPLQDHYGNYERIHVADGDLRESYRLLPGSALPRWFL